MISIIIPHHNDIKGLINLLNSIPKSDLFEVIIIDDHSNLSIKKIKKIVSQVNQNIIILENKSKYNSAGAARNIGLEKCKGDWVLFADSDDQFVNGIERTLRKAIEINSEIVFFPPISINTDSNKKSGYKDNYQEKILNYIDEPSLENEWRIRLTFDVPWSKLYKKKFIEDNKIFFDEVLRHNDTIFSQKCGILAQNIYVYNKTIYMVTKSSKSLSNKFSKPFFESMVNVNIRSIKLKKENVPNNLLDDANPEIQIQPLKYILMSFKYFRNYKYTLNICNLYKKEGLLKVNFKVIKRLYINYKRR